MRDSLLVECEKEVRSCFIPPTKLKGLSFSEKRSLLDGGTVEQDVRVFDITRTEILQMSVARQGVSAPTLFFYPDEASKTKARGQQW